MNRPITTLFLLSSVDGRISTGEGKELDFDKDLLKVPGVRDGLNQYYEAEKNTDTWSLNTGATLAKIGINDVPRPHLEGVSFLIFDNKHLEKTGIINLCSSLDRVVIATHNHRHPGFDMKIDNLHMLYDMTTEDVLSAVYAKYGCRYMTIQTGGTFNAMLLRHKLVDRVHIIMAPLLVGGKGVPSIMDGEPIKSVADLNKLVPLKLKSIEKLANSYISLMYLVGDKDT